MSDAGNVGATGAGGSSADVPCPVCGARRVRVEEDVSDEVTVFACDECECTWAVRSSEPGRS